MDYKKRLEEAFSKTKNLDFTIDIPLFPLKVVIPKEIKKHIFQLCTDALNHYGYVSSSELAAKCTPVHLMIQSHLKSNLNIDSCITIGDLYWDDYIYCEMTGDSIKKELENPKVHETIKAHVWLTLLDGTILDCTAQAHLDLLQDRGVHPAHECIMLVEPNKSEDAKSGYHRPFLLGTDFLTKTGMVRVGYL
ncbi:MULTISPECIES: hypothetical protein [Shewanella]|uniref:Uncharacterized protein n=1 Tax=Shewanella psychromarinicola TaxID=2487742 RepID=A0A3N4D9U8_9GAMM|nr:hypothetical protein [Shewanella psychromarinicola]AZG35788.1 hypothetical protein EGC80_13455 [Shewanella psychromarinicola]MCL1083854.1 hypothetical protein [Shewanella psychromarinicola]RPA22695.1 hypothetical protein EGC77_21090 [Shewanella psychromarinicola]